MLSAKRREIYDPAVAQAIALPERAIEQGISIRAARRDYLDALKVMLKVRVIAHHAGQPYAPTDGRWPVFEAERAVVPGPFLSVNAAFFMGLFFMVSAYFLPRSLDRKGTWTFVKTASFDLAFRSLSRGPLRAIRRCSRCEKEYLVGQSKITLQSTNSSGDRRRNRSNSHSSMV
jgi:Acyltransferase family